MNKKDWINILMKLGIMMIFSGCIYFYERYAIDLKKLTENERIDNFTKNDLNRDKVIRPSSQPKFTVDNLITEISSLAQDSKSENADYFDAIKTKNMTLLQNIIDSKADFSILNDDGYNALHYAASEINIEAINLLIKTKLFDLESTTNNNSKDTALILACLNSKKNKTGIKTAALEAIKILVENGAKIDSTNSENVTSLSIAVDLSCHELVEYLLKNGADPNAIISKDNNYVLHQSMVSCKREIIKTLIDHGAKISKANGWNRAPIHEAAFQGCLPGLREIILTRKISKNSRTPKLEHKKFLPENEPFCLFGATPLHFAAMKNHLEIIEFLLLIRSNLQINDEFGNKALYYAIQSRNIKARNYLKKRSDWENSVVMKRPQMYDENKIENLIRASDKLSSLEDGEIAYQFYRTQYLHQLIS